MSRYGNDFPYADTRLTGSIALTIDGRPIYINKISPASGNASVTYLLDMSDDVPNQQTVVHLDDIEACPVKLGYANSAAGGAVYLTRMPVRRYKQGLIRNENLASLNKDPRWVTWKELGLCILGNYPSFEKIISSMGPKNYNNPFEGSLQKGKNDGSLAWHRNWCLKKDMSVEYKGTEKVGKFCTEQRKVILDDSYKYLQEALQESFNVNRT